MIGATGDDESLFGRNDPADPCFCIGASTATGESRERPSQPCSYLDASHTSTVIASRTHGNESQAVHICRSLAMFKGCRSRLGQCIMRASTHVRSLVAQESFVGITMFCNIGLLLWWSVG